MKNGAPNIDEAHPTYLRILENESQGLLFGERYPSNPIYALPSRAPLGLANLL